jgi:histidine ammonia-lyase
VHALLRQQVPSMMTDRYLAPDMEHATELVFDGSLANHLRRLPGLPPLWVPV